MSLLTEVILPLSVTVNGGHTSFKAKWTSVSLMYREIRLNRGRISVSDADAYVRPSAQPIDKRIYCLPLPGGVVGVWCGIVMMEVWVSVVRVLVPWLPVDWSMKYFNTQFNFVSDR